MVTIQQIAACAGLQAPEFSVRALFGDAAPPLSLLELAAQRTQRKIDLNIILVGWEAFVGVGVLEIASAVAHLREVYSAIDLGIGNVSYFGISRDDANGHEIVDSDAEAAALRAEWGFAGKAIDAFFVLSWVGPTVGQSPINGACSEHDTDSALVVDLEEAISTTGNTLAHELGHYLGQYDRTHDENNLMHWQVPNGEQLTSTQGRDMRRHCIVYSGCRVTLT
jgi:hypothetical protein